VSGAHDMGGCHGFGPVQPEPDEPLFHAEWEKRALGLTLAMGASGQWNIDMSRAARESLPEATYLSSTYYRIWILAMQQLLLERGLVTENELQTGHALAPAKPLARVLRADDVAPVLARGAPTLRETRAKPLFAAGDRVTATPVTSSRHTRLPRYVHGHAGVVQQVRGAHVYADRHAQARQDAGFDERPEWLYTVVFEGRELWGDRAEAGTQVSVDAWEPYLLACPAPQARS
jgi:nitrile hydratase subunit beta